MVIDFKKVKCVELAGPTHEKDTEQSRVPVMPAQAGIQHDKRLGEAPYSLLYIHKYRVASQHIVFAGHLPAQV